MNNFNTINVKELPQLEQILAGNYLIVENNAGTNKLDFSDFVIGPQNTSFYNGIANNIFSLSASQISLSTAVSAVSSDYRSLSARVISNTTDIQLLSAINQTRSSVVYRKRQFSIAANETTATIVVTIPTLAADFTNSDINVKRLYSSPDYNSYYQSPGEFTTFSLSGVPVEVGNDTTYTLFVSSNISSVVERFYSYTIVVGLD